MELKISLTIAINQKTKKNLRGNIFFTVAFNNQEIVRGQVTDAVTGEAFPGATILVEGTTTGTTTDLEGRFEFGVPSLDARLIITL